MLGLEERRVQGVKGGSPGLDNTRLMYPYRVLLQLGISPVHRSRANVAHVRQSTPGSGLGVQVKVLQPVSVVPYSLESGWPDRGSRGKHACETLVAAFLHCLFG